MEKKDGASRDFVLVEIIVSFSFSRLSPPLPPFLLLLAILLLLFLFLLSFRIALIFSGKILPDDSVFCWLLQLGRRLKIVAQIIILNIAAYSC